MIESDHNILNMKLQLTCLDISKIDKTIATLDYEL